MNILQKSLEISPLLTSLKKQRHHGPKAIRCFVVAFWAETLAWRRGDFCSRWTVKISPCRRFFVHGIWIIQNWGFYDFQSQLDTLLGVGLSAATWKYTQKEKEKHLHPQKLTWNLKIHPEGKGGNIKLNHQILGFHVCFGVCNYFRIIQACEISKRSCTKRNKNFLCHSNKTSTTRLVRETVAKLGDTRPKTNKVTFPIGNYRLPTIHCSGATFNFRVWYLEEWRNLTETHQPSHRQPPFWICPIWSSQARPITTVETISYWYSVNG